MSLNRGSLGSNGDIGTGSDPPDRPSTGKPTRYQPPAVTRDHGVIFTAIPEISALEYTKLINTVLGKGKTIFISRISNNRVSAYLETPEMAEQLALNGFDVRGINTACTRLTKSSEKYIISNCPPEITNEYLIPYLSRYGKLTSKIQYIELYANGDEIIEHVFSFKRQFFILPEKPLPHTLNIKFENHSYTIFFEKGDIICEKCNRRGHTAVRCYEKKNEEIRSINHETPLVDIEASQETETHTVDEINKAYSSENGQMFTRPIEMSNQNPNNISKSMVGETSNVPVFRKPPGLVSNKALGDFYMQNNTSALNSGSMPHFPPTYFYVPPSNPISSNVTLAPTKPPQPNSNNDIYINHNSSTPISKPEAFPNERPKRQVSDETKIQQTEADKKKPKLAESNISREKKTLTDAVFVSPQSIHQMTSHSNNTDISDSDSYDSDASTDSIRAAVPSRADNTMKLSDEAFGIFLEAVKYQRKVRTVAKRFTSNLNDLIKQVQDKALATANTQDRNRLKLLAKNLAKRRKGD